MAWLKYLGIFLGGTLVLAVIAVVVVQRTSDGPIEFLQGGPFRTGELVEQPVTDWSFGVDKRTEFELVGFGTSRVAGYVMYDGKAYMTCDLGFMWNRLEGGPQKWLLRLIYTFKRWHHQAEQDGRALLRIDGKLYKANFVKVEDPELKTILGAKLEDLAREYFKVDLGPAPTAGPRDIWFFRMDPRS